MNIRFAEEQDLAAVARFNSRLKAGGREEEMPLDPALPGEAQYRPEGFPVYRRLIIAEDGQEVRAAMLLCHHNVFIRGESHDFYWTKMPLSEGIVNAKYSLAIIHLMKKALARHPFMMGVGAGTPDSDGFRLFASMRWRYEAVPFFFFPVRVSAVLRGLRYMQKNAKLRYGALLGAYSGAGAGVSGLLALRRKLLTNLSDYETSIAATFADWADEVTLEFNAWLSAETSMALSSQTLMSSARKARVAATICPGMASTSSEPAPPQRAAPA